MPEETAQSNLWVPFTECKWWGVREAGGPQRKVPSAAVLLGRKEAAGLSPAGRGGCLPAMPHLATRSFSWRDKGFLWAEGRGRMGVQSPGERLAPPSLQSSPTPKVWPGLVRWPSSWRLSSPPHFPLLILARMHRSSWLSVLPRWIIWERQRRAGRSLTGLVFGVEETVGSAGPGAHRSGWGCGCFWGNRSGWGAWLESPAGRLPLWLKGGEERGNRG